MHQAIAASVITAASILGATPPIAQFDDHDHPHPHPHVVKVPDKEAHRPSRLPDRIVLTWQSDPATSQAVTWRTSTDVKQAIGQIAIAEAGPNFIPKAAKHAATSQTLATDLGVATYHTVHFTQLKPNTKYVYRVGDGVNYSEWFQFSTASDKREPFTFVYFGDAQNSVKSLWSRVVREAHADAPRARFMLHAGDLINRAQADAEWGEWFGAGGWLNGMIPVIATPGNHEYHKTTLPDKSTVRSLSHHWRPQFAFPTNGPDGLAETVYWLDVQGVRIISLNSNEAQAEQVDWLESTLAKNPCTWTIITFHHPIYSMAKERDNPELRRLWKPIFDRHKVDLVLTGHDHSYGRTGLAVPAVSAKPTVGTENVSAGANVHVEQAGTVYVVSVSGPKMYPIRREPFMKRVAEDTQLYQLIHIDGSTLRFEARTATGELYDAFTLKKRPGQTNEFLDQAPSTPETRRPPKAEKSK